MRATCGAVDEMSGAVCTDRPHAGPAVATPVWWFQRAQHTDASDPLTVISWPEPLK